MVAVFLIAVALAAVVLLASMAFSTAGWIMKEFEEWRG